MLLKIACALWLAGTLLAADEHKPEPKKVETHSPEPPKKEEVKKEEAKKEEKPSPVKAAEAKPAAVEAHRPTPKMTPRRNVAARVPARASRPSVAATAVKPAPIVVEVKQEPTRVEAILRIVPYIAPGALYPNPGFNQSFAVSSLNTPRTQWPNEGNATQNPQPVEAPRETMVGIFAPANFAPAPGAPSYDPPQPRNPAPPTTLKKAPKNALTNEGLVILAEAGYDEEFILDLMKMKNCRFDTSAEGLAYMATHGLTERLVKAALQADIESERKGPELEAHR